MKTTMLILLALTLLGGVLMVGCQSGPEREPLRAIDRPIQLERFMGDWYVIAHIPAFIEDEAYNGVESYRLAEDGTIPTTYTFNNGGFDGPKKTYHPKGFVYNQQTKAEWRMQFLWPFKSAYLIVYLDDTYETTIIGVPDRGYAWIMARTKTLPEKRYQELVGMLADSGHDVSKLRRVPQK
jgi:apolipoprotein D and lipocalin family protein